MDSEPYLHSSGQRRHHTWHNAPKKRVYDQSVWDLQGHNAAYGYRGRANNWESDSESEVSEYSAPRVKRQVSELGSECGSSDDLPTLARNQDLRPSSLGPSSGGGTWPRPSKRRSDESSGKMNIWELTRALEREKTDLADQLARLTAHSSRDASYQENLSDLGGHSGGHLGHGGGPGPSYDAVLPLNGLPHSLPHASPIEEESPRSGYSGHSVSLKEAQLARELQLLVQDGMMEHDPAQDGMVEAILDALQTDVDSPQSMSRQLPGLPGDALSLPESVLGGPSGPPPKDRSSSAAARKASVQRNAELAEAYPGTGMGGQLMLPAAAMGAHARSHPMALGQGPAAVYGEDGTQATALWRGLGIPRADSDGLNAAVEGLGSAEAKEEWSPSFGAQTAGYEGLTLEDLPADMRDKLLQEGESPHDFASYDYLRGCAQ